MLYQAGCTFKKSGIERHLPSRNTFYALPLYPFDKHEYWFSYGSRRDLQEIWADHLTITRDDYDIFKHHQLTETSLLPEAFYVDLALKAIRSRHTDISSFYDLKFHSAAQLDENMTFRISAHRDRYYGFLSIEISTGSGAKNTLRFSAKVSEKGV
jgi:hypothetical protein